MTIHLPQGWICEPAGALFETQTGNTPSKKEVSYYGPGVPLVKPPELQGCVINRAEDNLTAVGAEKARVLPVGSVLVSCIGNLGKTGINSVPVAYNQQINAILPNEALAEPRFIFYQASSATYRSQLEELSSATTISIVNRKKFDSIELRIAPLNEQRRIVEKIDTLFARLDKGEEAVREVQKLLTRYRQSVLKSAVTGQLVESDRSGWEALELGSLIEDIRYGTAKKCGYEEANTAVLRIPNVVGGIVDLDDLKYTDLTEKELDKLALQKGDVLIVRSNGSANLVARGAVVEGDAVGMAYAGYLIRLRVDQERILPEYLHLSLNSPQTRQIIERQARSTSGVHNINSGEVKAIAIELPPIDEQRKIMAAVDDALQKIVDLEHWCETELKRSASLRQSILKDAFAGRLIPQDPNDEPASALHARIATEKAPTKKTRRKASA